MIPDKQNTFPSPARILRSPMLMLISMLLVTAACMVEIAPAKLDAADGIPSKYRVLVSKLSSFLKSSEKPDIIILGSSLVLMPAVRCDEKLERKAACYEDWLYGEIVPEYSRAAYLEHLLSKAGLPVSIKNLGVASSIMSDHAGIFETLIQNGKKPGLVICGIAPRDFLDNTQRAFENTPTQMFLRELRSSGKLLPASFSSIDVQDWYESNEHQFKKVIALIRTKCAQTAASITNHPVKVSLVTTQEAAFPDLQGKPNLLKDLESYKKLYNPPNFEMMQKQRVYLDKFLSMAKANDVQVLLVNMPLTKENTSALDRGAYKAYLETISEISNKHGVPLLNIGSETGLYTLADFEDCCHLNAAGGKKLYEATLEILLRDQRLASTLQNQAAMRAAEQSESGLQAPSQKRSVASSPTHTH